MRSRDGFAAVVSLFIFSLIMLQCYLGKLDKIIVTSHSFLGFQSTELERVMVHHEKIWVLATC